MPIIPITARTTGKGAAVFSACTWRDPSVWAKVETVNTENVRYDRVSFICWGNLVSLIK